MLTLGAWPKTPCSSPQDSPNPKRKCRKVSSEQEEISPPAPLTTLSIQLAFTMNSLTQDTKACAIDSLSGEQTSFQIWNPLPPIIEAPSKNSVACSTCGTTKVDAFLGDRYEDGIAALEVGLKLTTPATEGFQILCEACTKRPALVSSTSLKRN